MGGIFISYRRDDSQGFAGRLADDLDDELGSERVFRDIEIPVGVDFTDVLHRAIAASDALLVVIGRSWAAPAPAGQGDRLREPTDWVRTEIEAAFAQDKHVVPVLVGGATMPPADALPTSIARLSRLQAASLSDRHWRQGVAALAARLRELSPKPARRRPPRRDGDTPAEVLRELGERLMDQVEARRRPRLSPPRLPPTFGQQLLRVLGRGLRRTLTVLFVLAVIYVGIRLLGDAPLLRGLDAFEARLELGWERLQGYLARL